MGFNEIDWCIIGIITISSVISLWRGFVKEVLSLVIWIVAVIIGWLFGGSLSDYLSPTISAHSLRVIISCLILFIGTLIVGAIINAVLAHLIKATGLSTTDRFLGIFFGAARGGVIVVILVGLFSMGPVEEDDWWKSSQLLPYFLRVADWSKNMVLGGDKQWTMQNLAPNVELPNNINLDVSKTLSQ